MRDTVYNEAGQAIGTLIRQRGGTLVLGGVGGALGSVIGTILAPGIGTIIGGAIGGALGGIAGEKIDNTFACNYCPARFRSFEDLNRHYLLHRN